MKLLKSYMIFMMLKPFVPCSSSANLLEQEDTFKLHKKTVLTHIQSVCNFIYLFSEL